MDRRHYDPLPQRRRRETLDARVRWQSHPFRRDAQWSAGSANALRWASRIGRRACGGGIQIGRQDRVDALVAAAAVSHSLCHRLLRIEQVPAAVG
jgi:hypothetical protein